MVPTWIDRLLENDIAASIGAAIVFLILILLLVLDLVPAEHKEAAGALATASGGFALAAFRRAGAPKRRELASRSPER